MRLVDVDDRFELVGDPASPGLVEGDAGLGRPDRRFVVTRDLRSVPRGQTAEHLGREVGLRDLSPSQPTSLGCASSELSNRTTQSKMPGTWASAVSISPSSTR